MTRGSFDRSSGGAERRLSSPSSPRSKGHLNCPPRLGRTKALPLDPRYAEGHLTCSATSSCRTKALPFAHRCRRSLYPKVRGSKPRSATEEPNRSSGNFVHRYLGSCSLCSRACTDARRSAKEDARREGGCRDMPLNFKTFQCLDAPMPKDRSHDTRCCRGSSMCSKERKLGKYLHAW